MKKVLHDYFGDPRHGKVGLVCFLTMWVVLTAASELKVPLMLLVSSGTEACIGIDPFMPEGIIRRQGMLMLAGSALSAAAIWFASLNIAAKRYRDVGLPGWLCATCFAGSIVPLNLPVVDLAKPSILFAPAATMCGLLLLPPGKIRIGR